MIEHNIFWKIAELKNLSTLRVIGTSRSSLSPGDIDSGNGVLPRIPLGIGIGVELPDEINPQ